jgi:hypothetical protein
MRECLALRLGRSAEPQAHARNLGSEDGPGRKPQGSQREQTRPTQRATRAGGVPAECAPRARCAGASPLRSRAPTRRLQTLGAGRAARGLRTSPAAPPAQRGPRSGPHPGAPSLPARSAPTPATRRARAAAASQGHRTAADEPGENPCFDDGRRANRSDLPSLLPSDPYVGGSVGYLHGRLRYSPNAWLEALVTAPSPSGARTRIPVSTADPL